MPSELTPRNRRSGFTLLETLIAFAILVTVLAAVYGTALSLTTRAQRGNDTRDLSELAYAVLAEYTATYPSMPNTGQLGSRYEWSVSERPYPVENSEGLINARYVEIEILAWQNTRPEAPKTLRTVLAVRTQ